LQKIKVEQNVIKSLTKTGDSLTQYALDFIGPIMPYHIHRLCHLFKITNGEFEMINNTYESSSSLNCVKSQEQVNNLKDIEKLAISSFLDLSELNSLQQNYGIFGEAQSIKSIEFKDKMFRCNY
jgi:hypothetical protein